MSLSHYHEKVNKMKKFITLLFLTSTLLCSCVEVIPEETLPTTEPVETTAPTAATVPVDATEPDTPERRISFLGCGDNIVYYGNVLDASLTAGARTYNFAPMYTYVKDAIAGADIAMINQETLMAGEGYDFSYYPRFNGPQDMGHDLVDVGFDVISIANNHMLDKNADGLYATIDFWATKEVLQIGGYKSTEEYESLHILERDGIRVAFLAYTYGTNGIPLDEGSSIAIPLLEEETLRRQIKAAREASDFVIVSVHWGEEGAFTPNEEQKSYARIMTEAGADAIIGHHPHVIQPIEWLTAPDGSRTLCVYSLGNFAAEQAYDYNMVGGMISFDIVKDEAGTRIDSPLFHPTVYYFKTNFRGNTVYPMDMFTEELAASHGIGYYGNSTTLQRLREYVTDTISQEFLFVSALPE